jgi:uncharacterized membrane protein YphA (DoxX/SURF4 family)
LPLLLLLGLLPPLLAVLLLLLLLPQAAIATAEPTTAHPAINFPSEVIFLLCSAWTARMVR